MFDVRIALPKFQRYYLGVSAFTRRFPFLLFLCLFFFGESHAVGSCESVSSATFNINGTTVTAKSSKELSNVVLQFCDRSADLKFDNLSGSKEKTFSFGAKELSGVWIKAGCNSSGDGPGYGEFFRRTCAVPTLTPTPTPTPHSSPTPAETASPSPQPSTTPTATPTPETTIICLVPDGAAERAYSILIPMNELAGYIERGASVGTCPEDCMGIPFGSAVIDLCGICGGDNSSCRDCTGTPNGNARLDSCGVCGGDGTTCLGCNKQPRSSTVIDACGVCGGDNSSCLDCAGTPNGGKTSDSCGVCGGNNSTCLDCAGTPNGSRRLDVCGVCGGDGTTCNEVSSCSGPVDRCGVCNGNNACLDCAGIPNGGTTIDCCGICGGDGTTCSALCTEFDLRAEKKLLTTSVRRLLSTIIIHSKREAQCRRPRVRSSNQRIRASQVLASRIANDLTTLLPDRVKLCDTPFCSKTSAKGVLSASRENLRRLYNLSKSAQRADISACGVRRGKGSRASATLFTSAITALSKLPVTRCSN